ncbi:TetR/AcrR family transcriptional regulator [Desulfocurvus sp. DL9XJH121]
MKRKDKILFAATRMFAHKGFTDTSTHELAEVTGVAESTIFYHFRTKEELFLAVLRSVRREILKHFETFEAEQEFSDGMKRVEGVLGYYLYLAGTLEDAFLLLHRHYPYMLALENDVCREHLEAIYNCLVDVFERAVAQGRADGSIGPVHERKVAMVLFTMVDGLVRFKNYRLYDAGALFNEMLVSARKILANGQPQGVNNGC